MNIISRLFVLVTLIALVSCEQKESPDYPEDIQESSCPLVIELDTLNALDVGFKCRIEGDILEGCGEVGVIYYKNTSSTVQSENILPLYVRGSDSEDDEYIEYIRVEPESEYEWRPYIIKDDVKTIYKSSSFKVGKAFSVAAIQPEKGCIGLDVTVPFTTRIAYVCVENPRESISVDEVLFMGANRILEQSGPYFLSVELKENTHYYLYIVASKGLTDYTEVLDYEFDTGVFVEEEMLVLESVGYDGFTMRINMPPSVRMSTYGTPGSRAIRYAFGNLLMYNMNRSRGYDDYYTLLNNGLKSLQNDCILEVSDENMMANVDYDVNKDGVIDGNDVDYQWNPIAPGEPIVFIAGEFEWMQLPDGYDENISYDINGFCYPYNWAPGYYLPCLDPEKYFAPDDTKSIVDDIDLAVEMDGYWTGAFQRKLFKVKEPALLDAEMRVNITDVTAADAHIELVPGDEIYSYCFCILDKDTYNRMLSWMEGHEDYLQWFTTSYFAAYHVGAISKKGKYDCNLSDYFISGYAQPYSEYHVLVTALGDKEGTTQQFIHEVIYTTPYESQIPVIDVTAATEYCTPGYAVFNIRNTDLNNPITEAYVATKYIAEWEKALNEGYTYASLTHSSIYHNTAFTISELEHINSEEGLYYRVSGESNQIMRMAVLGYNEEGRSNELLSESSPGIADCLIP